VWIVLSHNNVVYLDLPVYFSYKILDISSGIDDIGHLNWKYLLYLLACHVIIWLSLVKSVQSIGKVGIFILKNGDDKTDIQIQRRQTTEWFRNGDKIIIIHVGIKGSNCHSEIRSIIIVNEICSRYVIFPIVL